MAERNELARVYAAHVTDGAPTPEDHLAGLAAVAEAVRSEQAKDLRTSEWKRKNAEHGAECARTGERQLAQAIREACAGLGITDDEPQIARVRLLRDRLNEAEAARAKAEADLARERELTPRVDVEKPDDCVTCGTALPHPLMHCIAEFAERTYREGGRDAAGFQRFAAELRKADR